MKKCTPSVPWAWLSPNSELLPAAEGVVRDRHGDRHVDPDHADLDLVLEPTRRAAVVGEDRGAVAVRVRVHERERVVVAVDAQDREHRTEDLVGVERHVRCHVVEQRRPEPEAAVVALHRVLAPVDDQSTRPRPRRRRGTTRPCSRCAPVISGPMSALVASVADGEPAMRSAILATSSSATAPTATTAEMAMQRSPAEPKPALTAASAARSRSASGSTTMWFFAPPSACTRLPARGALLVHVARDRRGADERHRLHVGVLEQAVDRDLVAVHDVEHARGEAGLGPQLAANQFAADGSFSLGFSTTALPARDRDREEPARHHRREVERADDRDDAERLAHRVDVDLGRDRPRRTSPFSRCGSAARELDDLEAACDLAASRRRSSCRARR